MPFLNLSAKWRFIGLGAFCIIAGLGWGLYDSKFWRTPPLKNFAAQKIVYRADAENANGVSSDALNASNDTAESRRSVVNFWATWCAPCVHEMPILEAASQANKQIYFSGWTLDNDSDAVMAFLRKTEITYDIFMPKADIFLYFEENGNKNGLLPYTVLLDENGRQIAQKLGEFHSVEEVEAFIEQH